MHPHYTWCTNFNSLSTGTLQSIGVGRCSDLGGGGGTLNYKYFNVMLVDTN